MHWRPTIKPIKTPNKLEAALDKLQPQTASEPLYLDPMTEMDHFTRAFAIVSLLGLAFSGYSIYNQPDSRALHLVLGPILLVLFVAALGTNDLCVVDFKDRIIKLKRSVLGLPFTLRSVPFDSLLTLAVSGHLEQKSISGENSRPWWEYGLAVLAKDGVSHAVFPKLTRDFQTACRIADRLAHLLDLPLTTPCPKKQLIVEGSDGTPSYSYESRSSAPLENQPSLETLLKAESSEETLSSATEPAGSVQISSPENDSITAGPERRHEDRDPDQYEVVIEENRYAQIGCALVGLLFVSPFGMAGLGFIVMTFKEPSVPYTLLSLFIGIPSILIFCYLVNWALNPITKQVFYIDRSRLARSDMVRSRGQYKASEVFIPQDAKVKIFERVSSSGSSSRTRTQTQTQTEWWVYIFAADDTKLFYLPRPKSRKEAVRTAQRVADLLDIEVEIEAPSQAS